MARKRSAKAASFLVLLSKQRWMVLQHVSSQMPRLRYVFGSEHLSLPSLSRYGLRAGDTVYPTFAADRKLHVICRCVLGEVRPIREFFASEFGVSGEQLAGSIWTVIVNLKPGRPELSHLYDDECLRDVAACEATPLRFDRALSGEALAAVRFESKNTERPIKHVTDGLLMNTASIQNGYFRLMPASAMLLDELAR